MQTIELSSHPEFKQVIKAADSTYKKRKAFFHVAENVALSGTYWDGGSRYTYTAVNLANGYSLGAPQYAPPQFGGPKQAPNVSIPAGVAIVKTGYFCGKQAIASVYLNPADVAKLLPN